VQFAAHVLDGVTQVSFAQQSALPVQATPAAAQVSEQKPRELQALIVRFVRVAQQPDAHCGSAVQTAAQKACCDESLALIRHTPEQQALGVDVQSAVSARHEPAPPEPVVPPVPVVPLVPFAPAIPVVPPVPAPPIPVVPPVAVVPPVPVVPPVATVPPPLPPVAALLPPEPALVGSTQTPDWQTQSFGHEPFPAHFVTPETKLGL
jgi:hypothetical protein